MDRLSQFEDWRGNTVRLFDKVIYPRMSGRSCEMQEGVVVEIVGNGTRSVRTLNPDLDPVWVWVDYPAYKVKIEPTRSSRGFWRDSNPKPVWVQLGENVTAVK